MCSLDVDLTGKSLFEELLFSEMLTNKSDEVTRSIAMCFKVLWKNSLLPPQKKKKKSKGDAHGNDVNQRKEKKNAKTDLIDL